MAQALFMVCYFAGFGCVAATMFWLEDLMASHRERPAEWRRLERLRAWRRGPGAGAHARRKARLRRRKLKASGAPVRLAPCDLPVLEPPPPGPESPLIRTPAD